MYFLSGVYENHCIGYFIISIELLVSNMSLQLQFKAINDQIGIQMGKCALSVFDCGMLFWSIGIEMVPKTKKCIDHCFYVCQK